MVLICGWERQKWLEQIGQDHASLKFWLAGVSQRCWWKYCVMIGRAVMETETGRLYWALHDYIM